MPVLKQLGKHKLLLDTHVWIFLMEGLNGLSKKFINHLESNRDENRLLLSTISIWELGMLESHKRITLNMGCMDWVDLVVNLNGVELADLTPKIAILSSRLPGNFHKDPADRILVATAYENNAVLVTKDSRLIAYGKDKFISVYDPS